MKRRVFLASAASLCTTPIYPQTIPNARALSGDRFVVDSEEFRLADVMAPPLYTLDRKTPAYFETARAELQNLLSPDLVVNDVADKTRWGVRIVTVKKAGSEETLQETLVAGGAVRVAPVTDDHELLDRLLALETAAREYRLGLWDMNAYRIFDAERAGGAVGAYNIIEGVVKRAANTRSRFYLNFGEDYRTDFTAGAVSRLYRRWAKGGLDLAALEGVRVRIRGFVEEINGPSIDLQHPKQIELLAAKTL